MNFPIEFRCPMCKARTRVIEEVKKELVERGKFNESTPVGSRQTVVGVFDPLKPGLSCPLILIIWDICAKCGTEYICRIERKEGQVSMMAPQGQKMPKLPYNFGKG